MAAGMGANDIPLRASIKLFCGGALHPCECGVPICKCVFFLGRASDKGLECLRFGYRFEYRPGAAVASVFAVVLVHC